jgi:hypothetical protein
MNQLADRRFSISPCQFTAVFCLASKWLSYNRIVNLELDYFQCFNNYTEQGFTHVEEPHDGTYLERSSFKRHLSTSTICHVSVSNFIVCFKIPN